MKGVVVVSACVLGLCGGAGCGSNGASGTASVGTDSSGTGATGGVGSTSGGSATVTDGDSGSDPCWETRAFLASLDADGVEQWVVQWEDESRAAHLALMEDGSIAHAIMQNIDLRTPGGELVASVPDTIEGFASKDVRSLLGLGGSLYAGGRADGGGQRHGRIDRYDMTPAWQAGVTVSSSTIEGERGVFKLSPDLDGGLYLHGDICTPPCGAWAERRTADLDLVWREEFEGDGPPSVGDIATAADGSLVVAIQNNADAETAGGSLVSYSLEGIQLWSRDLPRKISAIDITGTGDIVAATYGGSGTFLEAHDPIKQLWEKPTDLGYVPVLVAHGPSGFVVGARLSSGEPWLGLHDASGALVWDYTRDHEGNPADGTVEDVVVAPDGTIVVAGFVEAACSWGSSGG